MHLSRMKPTKGSRKHNRRVGRGESSGRGKTSGKGHKGQLARSGHKFGANFEGGQNPMLRRIPKFGFTNIHRKEIPIVNIGDFDRFKDGSTVDLAALQKEGLLKAGHKGPFKVLGTGEIKKSLTVKAAAFSKKAAEAIQKAGGKAEVIK